MSRDRRRASGMAPKGKKKGRAQKKKIKLRSLALGLFLGGGLLVTSLSLFLLSGGFSKTPSHEKTSRGISSRKQDVKGNQAARKPHRKEGRAPQRGEGSEGLPKVAILIDDVGFDVELARSFLELKPLLSLSILPTAPHAKAIAREAARKGAEVLLHLPMEAKESDDGDPGAGALLVTMGEEEFVKTLNRHLSRIPGIQGVNNHMGSLLTEREDKMALLFRELKKRRLFYVDSRTTPETVAARIAMEMKVPVASRSVFLDHDPSQETMGAQWDRLLTMAREHGHALVIAHPHRETLVFLRERLQDLRSEARLVRVADIVS